MLNQNILHSLINLGILARNFKTTFINPKVHKRIANTLMKKMALFSISFYVLFVVLPLNFSRK